MSEEVLRRQLIVLLRGGNAHLTFDETVANFPLGLINEPFPNGTYSAWALLEHIRLTQDDILDFMQNPNYKDKEWPRDSWPLPGAIATPEDWQETIDGFHAGARKLEAIVEDLGVDLYVNIPWGEGQNLLREILIIADHNSHHLGELSIMRQVMSTWGDDHERQEEEYRQRRSKQ